MEKLSGVSKFITGSPNWHGAPPEKRRAEWRYSVETGKYDNRPIDKEYFKKYMSVKSNALAVLEWFLGATYQSIKRGLSVLITRKIAK